jgi:hypothetical protein
MSNARAHRRRLSKARRDRCDHLTAALIACRVGGCTCEPDLSVRHVDRVPHIAAAHDEWCPLVGHASQLLIRYPSENHP